MFQLSLIDRLDVLRFIFSFWLRRKLYELEWKIEYFPIIQFPKLGVTIDIPVPIFVLALAILIMFVMG